jgi:hypothetical protein
MARLPARLMCSKLEGSLKIRPASPLSRSDERPCSADGYGSAVNLGFVSPPRY